MPSFLFDKEVHTHSKLCLSCNFMGFVFNQIKKIMIMMLLNCYIESYYHTNYRRVESCTLAKLEIKAQHFSILKYDSESSYKITKSRHH